MSTGAIIAIAAVAALVLIALTIAIPRMKRSAAERKLQQERRARAEEHRSHADQQRTKAELAEQEARKQRAEAEIHAKRAELHENGLADDELETGTTTTMDRTTTDPRETDGGRFREVTGGRAHEPASEADGHADATTERRFVHTEDRERVGLTDRRRR